MSQKRSKLVNVKVNESEYQKIKKNAKKRGETMSSIMRNALLENPKLSKV